MRRPIPALAAAALTGLALALAGCSSAASPVTTSPSGRNVAAQNSDNSSPGTNTTPTTPPVTLTLNVANAATKVPVDTRVSVSASGGTLDSVAMSYVSSKTKKPVAVAGTLGSDKASWSAGDLLEPGVPYTLTMKGTTTDGSASSQTSMFTTVALTNNQQVYPTLLPADGSTVGVAMPIVMTFDLPVPDRALAQKLISVKTTPATQGSFYWISSNEVHWRPAKYWAPGTKVVVDAPMNGVNLGKGMYGEYSRHSSFTIGSNVSATINLQTHQLVAYSGGQAVRTIPISGGKAASPTRSGIKVVMDKRTNFVMRASSLGLKPGDSEYYQPVFVQYALQVTNSGEFLHSAPWSVGAQGRYNVSHGCVGMSVANSRWLYDFMKVGDPVFVSGSNKPMSLGNGYADWNVAWQDWQKGSAA